MKRMKEKYERNIITSDSFLNDFNCRRIKRALYHTYEEGKADKEAALKAAGGNKIINE